MTDIYIDGWRRKVHFEAAHMIPGHQKCGRLHGHTYGVMLRLEGELDDSGMVADFGPLKRALKDILDRWDHRILIPLGMEGVSTTDDGVEIRLGPAFYRFPITDCALLDIPITTVEYLTETLADILLEEAGLPSTVTRVHVSVEEGPGQGASTTRDLPRH